VTNLLDSGPGSLRQAILDTAAGGTVDFQPDLSGTITLTSGELAINKDLTIAGPGADVITVSGNHASRVFDIAGMFHVGIAGLTIANGTTSGNGGGIYNSGTLTISDSTLSGNSASGSIGDGGAIENLGSLMINNSTLSGNSASFTGGGIENSGPLTISDSSLSGNSARGGGAIYSAFTTVTINNSTLSENSATLYFGGAIHNQGTLTVSNSTLSSNTASGEGGGGIYTHTTSPVTLTNVTLTANRGGQGGGLYTLDDSVLHNTLIAGNFRGATGETRNDVFGVLDPGGDYNLIGDGTGMTDLQNGVNGNLVGSAAAPIDPLLGPLQDNGGPTQTMALGAGSPALNAGNPAQLGVADQRGVVRTGGVNIGAYQASATAFLVSAPDTVQAGVPFDVTVTAVDPFGQVAVGYTGTVTFSTSDPDPGIVLPADYTFTLDDGGSHTFTDTGLGETTLITLGDQTLTVMDTADNTITGSTTVTVDSMAGAGSHGLVQAPQPGRLPGSVPQASEPPQRQVVAVDGWLASVNKRDVGFILAQPIHYTHAEADWWALDPWWGVERVA
jgi:hypothetical protein